MLELVQSNAARPAGGYFFGFLSFQHGNGEPEKFAAYRKRRPERPPAGTIACPTARQSRKP